MDSKALALINNTLHAAWTAKQLPAPILSANQNTSAIIIIMPSFP